MNLSVLDTHIASVVSPTPLITGKILGTTPWARSASNETDLLWWPLESNER